MRYITMIDGWVNDRSHYSTHAARPFLVGLLHAHQLDEQHLSMAKKKKNGKKTAQKLTNTCDKDAVHTSVSGHGEHDRSRFTRTTDVNNGGRKKDRAALQFE